MGCAVSRNTILTGLLGVLVTVGSGEARAQYPTVLDPSIPGFGPGLLDSPEVGRLEGIQRFGQSLRTDPDPGVGYTYRVLPPVGGKGGLDQESLLWALVHLPEANELKGRYHQLATHMIEREKRLHNGESTEDVDREILGLQIAIAELQLRLKLALGGELSDDFWARYAAGRDTTGGIRNLYSDNQRMPVPAFQAGVDPTVNSRDAVNRLGIGVDGTLFSDPNGPTPKTLFHQPLIQVKVRLVEASRRNSSEFRSVLDYISRQGPLSEVTANNINGNRQSTRAATRLPSGAGVVEENTPNGNLSNLSAGNGTLINLTTEHLNYITNMLVTQFSGDVFTVPEVVTLNGQNVEFVAGDKRPFPLGLTLNSGGNGVTRQEFVYKHVGTVLSVTPRIVNWGKHLEGNGEAPIVAQEVNNWNRLAAWMSNPANIHEPHLQPKLIKYGASSLPMPNKIKRDMLTALEEYPAQQLRERFHRFDALLFQSPIQPVSAVTQEDATGPGSVDLPLIPDEVIAPPPNLEAYEPEPPQPILRYPCGWACDWKPQNCTIDLELLVRQSNVNTDNAAAPEENENSIANVVQVRSGHGVVIGGMISTSELQTVSKIPVLGDLPGVGYAFRSKSTDREKSELIILVEARVLPGHGRDETAKDFQLGYDYVDGELHDNPLEVGMHRAGFGQYLPPSFPREEEFWLEHGNRMRRVVTELDDILN